MKEEDKKLKEILKRGIDALNDGTPDFWSMIDKVVEKPSKRNWFSLKIAASVVLFIAVGVLLIVRNQRIDSEAHSLIEWSEPTGELMPPTSSSSSTLSAWSSPTDFLLSNNIQQIKN